MQPLTLESEAPAPKPTPPASAAAECSTAQPLTSDNELDELHEHVNESCIAQYGKTFCEMLADDGVESSAGRRSLQPDCSALFYSLREAVDLAEKIHINMDYLGTGSDSKAAKAEEEQDRKTIERLKEVIAPNDQLTRDAGQDPHAGAKGTME